MKTKLLTLAAALFVSVALAQDAVQLSQLNKAKDAVEPLRAALSALPDQGSTNILTRQCLDAGRSLCAWVDALAKPMPTPDGKTVVSAPIPKETLRHVAAVGTFATGAAHKLMLKEQEEKLQAQYKWVRDLGEFIQARIVALAEDYSP